MVWQPIWEKKALNSNQLKTWRGMSSARLFLPKTRYLSSAPMTKAGYETNENQEGKIIRTTPFTPDSSVEENLSQWKNVAVYCYLLSFTLIWHKGLTLLTELSVAWMVTHLSTEPFHRCLTWLILSFIHPRLFRAQRH